MLYIISLPIGNREDISERAIQTLQMVDFILCEDTRNFQKYAKRFNINMSKLIAYEDFQERDKTPGIIKLIKDKQKKIGLVSDAGTPGISDPGYHIRNECYKENIPVIPIPGPSAPIITISICPFNDGKFSFYGFYEDKHLSLILESTLDLVFFDSPKRIRKNLEYILEHLSSDRKIFIAREMTKDHESFYLISHITDLDKIIYKGEFVFIVSKKITNDIYIDYKKIKKDFPNIGTKDLAKIISYFTKVSGKDIYNNLISL